MRRAIIRFIGEKGEVSFFEIHKELGYPAISIGRTCELLKERGYLLSEARPGRGPKRTKTVYKLTDLGRLAYVVMTGKDLSNYLTNLSITHAPNLGKWLSDPCMRDLIYISILVSAIRGAPEENKLLKELIKEGNMGDIDKTIIGASIILLRNTLAYVHIDSIIRHEKSKEKRKLYEYLHTALFGGPPYASTVDFVLAEYIVEAIKKSETVTELMIEDFPNLLKAHIYAQVNVLNVLVATLDTIEKKGNKRLRMLKKTFDEVFKDILLDTENY